MKCKSSRHGAQNRIDRRPFGAPVVAGVWKLGSNRIDLTRDWIEVGHHLPEIGFVGHVIDTGPYVDDRFEHGMRRDVRDPFTVDVDCSTVANTLPILITRANHGSGSSPRGSSQMGEIVSLMIFVFLETSPSFTLTYRSGILPCSHCRFSRRVTGVNVNQSAQSISGMAHLADSNGRTWWSLVERVPVP